MHNMVGVNMVLAEFARFKCGLYKSCGIECLEGIMLEPCLLQPCYAYIYIYIYIYTHIHIHT